MPMQLPNPVYIDVLGAKILGVKTYRINIFDAWKDKGVILKQPLATFKPPKEIKDIVNLGIASSLAKKEEEVKKSLKAVGDEVTLNEIVSKVKSMSPTPPTMPISPFVGGEMISLGDVWGGLQQVGNTVAGWLGQAGQTISKVGSDIGKVWNALVNLSDLVNKLSSFLRDWKSSNDVIMQRMMNINASTKALADMANKFILENRKFYATIMEEMHKALAEYFDDLTFNLLRYGQVDIPSAVVGSIIIKAKNSSAMPVTITIPDLSIKSGPYTLHKGTYMLSLMPFETDTGEVPFDISRIDEAKYVVERKKKYGTLPLVITGTMITPFGKRRLSITKTVKV